MRSTSLFVLFLVAAGCGGSVDNPGFNPANAPPVSEAEYCDKLAANACSVLVGCCNAAGYTADNNTCVTTYRANCQSQSESYKSRGLVFDSKNAGICVHGLTSTVNGCVQKPSTDPTVKTVSTACSSVWAGTVPIGGTCRSSTDCAKPSDGTAVSCSYTGTSTSGTCTVRKVANSGERCGSVDGSYVACAEGLYCAYDSATRTSTCGPYAAKGESCSTKPCATGLYCNSTTRVCGDPLPVGASCMSDSACGTTGYCDPTSRICTNRKPNGETCTSSNHCTSNYCRSGKCDDRTVASASTCRLAGSSGGDAGPGDAAPPPDPPPPSDGGV